MMRIAIRKIYKAAAYQSSYSGSFILDPKLRVPLSSTELVVAGEPTPSTTQMA